ncbi:MAG: carboxypeptidase-like regulatory domain-containing protein, partial [Rhodothermales bacterium]
MRRTLTYLLLIATFFAADLPWAHAQQQARARLEGHVRDAATGDGLEGVHVFVSRSGIGSITDEQGRYAFTLPLGAHRLVVSRIGHKTQT